MSSFPSNPSYQNITNSGGDMNVNIVVEGNADEQTVIKMRDEVLNEIRKNMRKNGR